MTNAITNFAIPSNVNNDERGWVADPQEIIDAIHMFELNKCVLFGAYHMHSSISWNGNASKNVPSELDKFLADGSNLFTFIVSIHDDGNHSIRAFYESRIEVRLDLDVT
jgi:hypothetical protein